MNNENENLDNKNTTDTKDTNTQRMRTDRAFLWVLIAVGLLAVASILLALFYYDSHVTQGIEGLSGVRREEWGQFGDYVGGVLNPFLSFLALIAVLIAIVLQNKELQYSREELRRSSQALEEQSESFRIQNFENTFFQMVRLHHDIVGGINLNEFQVNKSGRDCFKYFYETVFCEKYQVFRNIEDSSGTGKNLTQPQTLQIIEDAYLAFIYEQEHDVGQYFRNLYNIFEYVDESDIDCKSRYARYLSGLLSSHELLMIFYNSVFAADRERFKPLLEKYGVFENLDLSELINPYNHVPLYSQQAYGKQEVGQYFK